MYPAADVEKTQAPIGEDEHRLGQQIGREPSRYDECNATCPMSSEKIVAEFFKYHPPNSETLPKFAAINQAAKNFAEVVLANCPSGSDRAAAINAIRGARMTANAAIALNGLSLYS